MLLAGDLTTHGEAEQAKVLADAVATSHPGHHRAGQSRLARQPRRRWSRSSRTRACIVLDRTTITTSSNCDGVEVGIVGIKGHVGGFPGCYLPDFGEP